MLWNGQASQAASTACHRKGFSNVAPWTSNHYTIFALRQQSRLAERLPVVARLFTSMFCIRSWWRSNNVIWFVRLGVALFPTLLVRCPSTSPCCCRATQSVQGWLARHPTPAVSYQDQRALSARDHIRSSFHTGVTSRLYLHWPVHLQALQPVAGSMLHKALVIYAQWLCYTPTHSLVLCIGLTTHLAMQSVERDAQITLSLRSPFPQTPCVDAAYSWPKCTQLMHPVNAKDVSHHMFIRLNVWLRSVDRMLLNP